MFQEGRMGGGHLEIICRAAVLLKPALILTAYLQGSVKEIHCTDILTDIPTM